MKIRNIVNHRRRGIEVEGTIVDMVPVALSRSRRTLMKATLRDETGEINLNLWGSQSLECREGDRVRIMIGFTRKNAGRFEINIGSVDDIEVIGSSP